MVDSRLVGRLTTPVDERSAGMSLIPGGTFVMGSDHHYAEEAPAHEVAIDSFWLNREQVTNAEFADFVAQTRYVTVAERPLDPQDYPGAPPEKLAPGSLVFVGTLGPVSLQDYTQWWSWTPGAQWRHPEGTDSNIVDRQDHPVVHVAYEDAATFAAWARKRLPTEAEWERAARGGIVAAEFVWGSEQFPSGRHLANWWQGQFPWRNSLDDGFERTAPVGSYLPNGYGLHDMAGNVWEWTSDWYSGERVPRGCCAPTAPRIAREDESYDPAQPQTRIPRRVVKGGSFACADEYCRRYRPAARQAQMIDTGMSHIGFRCAAGTLEM